MAENTSAKPSVQPPPSLPPPAPVGDKWKWAKIAAIIAAILGLMSFWWWWNHRDQKPAAGTTLGVDAVAATANRELALQYDAVQAEQVRLEAERKKLNAYARDIAKRGANLSGMASSVANNMVMSNCFNIVNSTNCPIVVNYGPVYVNNSLVSTQIVITRKVAPRASRENQMLHPPQSQASAAPTQDCSQPQQYSQIQQQEQLAPVVYQPQVQYAEPQVVYQQYCQPRQPIIGFNVGFGIGGCNTGIGFGVGHARNYSGGYGGGYCQPQYQYNVAYSHVPSPYTHGHR